MEKRYDVVIIGGGPAGLTAGIYNSRDKLNCLLIDKGIIGGNINNAESIENYPGFPEGINGPRLAELMHQQSRIFGLENIITEVTAIDIQDKDKIIKTISGDFISKAVIIAGGSEKVKLGVPGEKEFTGKGVSYCSTCDGPFFRNKIVTVIGGGNSAIYEALHLTKFASKINVIHRRDQLRATAILQDRARSENKIRFILNTIVKIIEGKAFVEKLLIQDINTGKEQILKTDGVFISIGLKPNTDYLKDLLPLDKQGHIITDDQMCTNIAGIFAAGDIRSSSIRQITTAVGEGTTAATSARKFINGE